MGSAKVAGKSSPLGATVTQGGVNFSLFSRTATGVELLLFDREDDGKNAMCAGRCGKILNTSEGQAHLAEGRMKVGGAIYEIESGRVRFLSSE